MRHQQASTVIAATPSQVWRFVTDVAGWPQFLIGLESVTPQGHERYRFRIVDGVDRHENTVMVRCNATTRVASWRELDGCRFRGRIAVQDAGPGHARVTLELDAHPGTMVAGFAEMVLPGLDRAARDLARLDQHLHPRQPAEV